MKSTYDDGDDNDVGRRLSVAPLFAVAAVQPLLKHVECWWRCDNFLWQLVPATWRMPTELLFIFHHYILSSDRCRFSCAVTLESVKSTLKTARPFEELQS